MKRGQLKPINVVLPPVIPQLPPKIDIQTAQVRDYRKELWIGVATAVAGSSNCVHKTSPVTWADSVLEAFDTRFPSTKEPT